MAIPRNLLIKIGIHTVCWTAFVIYEVAINYYLLVPIPLSSAYFYVCNISLFYIHAEILSLTINRPDPAWKLMVLLVLAELLISSIIKFAGDLLTLPAQMNFPANRHILSMFLVTDLSRSILYVALSTLYWYRGYNVTLRQEKADMLIREIRAGRQNAELQASLADARNAYLQQQLNPHLIFNTLNFIYNAVYRVSDDGGKAVLLLADILNFSLREPDETGKILLADEMEQVENLIKINRYRFHYPLQIDLITTGQTGDHHILPLVLLTLTENMFKHGDFRDSPAIIQLDITTKGTLQFMTKNTKKLLGPGKPTNGIGIRNIRLRLEHTYGDNSNLEINETDTYYQTKLKIQL